MISAAAQTALTQSIDAVDATLEQWSTLFYRNLFRDHPTLLTGGTFNAAKQATGEQPRALGRSVVAAARLLADDPATDLAAVFAPIAHRHASLAVQRPHYDVVYTYLFGAIGEVLGEALTPDLAAAWTAVYWEVADALSGAEQTLYDERGGSGWTPWRVASIAPAGGRTASVTFVPADPAAAPYPAAPGQYVAVRLTLREGYQQSRQYTLSDAAEPGRRTITVRRQDGGEVSAAILDRLAPGDAVDLSEPFGLLTLDDDARPLVLATAGIGATPSAALLDALARRGSDRRVVVAHADTSLADWALREQMAGAVAALPNASLDVWLPPAEAAAADAVAAHPGRLRLADLDLPGVDQRPRIVLCGPRPFLAELRREAVALGYPDADVEDEAIGYGVG